MPIPGLSIIGERINPGFASSRALIDAADFAGIQRLAQQQVERGAEYLTINVGVRAEHDHSFVVDMIRAVQEVVDVPLSFDYPQKSVQEVCLRAYDPAKARFRKPIVNSISELRWDMIELARDYPCRIILMSSERLEQGNAQANRSAREVADTAQRLVEQAVSQIPTLKPSDLYIDVSLCPISTDTEGLIRTALESIGFIGADPSMRDVHMVVGLSNLSIMLPAKAADSSNLKLQVESAFLTLAIPLGLDTILGTPGREYSILPEHNAVLRGVKQVLAADGFDALMRVQELYTSSSPA